MGCGSSSLAVVELNRSLKTTSGTHALQDKLHSCPWLLSAATPVFSSTAGTPLHTACQRKQIEVVQQMLSFLSGASLPVVREALKPYCSRHGLALPNAAAEGVRIAVSMTNCKGQTPLMCACAAGCPELVKLLLAQGADPWAGDRCGARTALHYAAMAGSAPCIEALMSNLPVHRRAQRLRRHRLHYAVFLDQESAIEELLRHDPQLTAATSGNSYDIFLTFPSLSTPLHFAALRGNVAIVRQLLRHHVLHPASSGARSRDPRLRADHSQHLPWEVAAAHHTSNRELLQLLHPGRPLEQALGLAVAGGGGSSATRIGPSSLAAIAAAALFARLTGDLKRLEGQGPAGSVDRSAAGGSAMPVTAATSAAGGRLVSSSLASASARTPACGAAAAATVPAPSPLSVVRLSHASRPLAPGGSCCGKAAASVPAADTNASGSTGDGDDEAAGPPLCGVCFVEREAVAPVGCGHGVCGRCAGQMCRVELASRSRPRPLLCPFCRREVAGFVALSTTRQGARGSLCA
ncbi:hypothetical protein PLESTM_000055700 [Pleodorina starrii]|nr:hypothetical protein PLESTM_000055700 [Pleodorina starrii]